MRFNTNMTFRGKSALSWIEKNEKSHMIDVVMDYYGNKSILSFDSICFDSFVGALNEYKKNGKVSYDCSESCRGQSDLDVFILNLSEDKRFMVRFDLADVHGSCSLIMRSGSWSDYTQISVCLSEGQLKKLIGKFTNAVKAREALREAEKEISLRTEGLRP